MPEARGPCGPGAREAYGGAEHGETGGSHHHRFEVDADHLGQGVDQQRHPQQQLLQGAGVHRLRAAPAEQQRGRLDGAHQLGDVPVGGRDQPVSHVVEQFEGAPAMPKESTAPAAGSTVARTTVSTPRGAMACTTRCSSSGLPSLAVSSAKARLRSSGSAMSRRTPPRSARCRRCGAVVLRATG